MSLRRATIAAGIAALAFALAGGASAGLKLSASPDPVTVPAVTLNGLDQQQTFSVDLRVTGAGSSGWNVTAWAPEPTGSTGPLGPLVVPSAPSGGGTSSGISWPVTLGTSADGAVKIANALPGTDNGSGSLIVTFELTVPANALAGSYATTVDLAVASGP